MAITSIDQVTTIILPLVPHHVSRGTKYEIIFIKELNVGQAPVLVCFSVYCTVVSRAHCAQTHALSSLMTLRGSDPENALDCKTDGTPQPNEPSNVKRECERENEQQTLF